MTQNKALRHAAISARVVVRGGGGRKEEKKKEKQKRSVKDGT